MVEGQTTYGGPPTSYHQTIDVSALQHKEQNDFNRMTQDFAQVITDLDMFLAGIRLVKDQKTGDWAVEKLPGGPLMNAQGREFVKSRLRTYLNANTYMSSLKQEDADNTYKLDIANFACDIFGSSKEYAMTRDACQKVVHVVSPVIYFALRKSQTDKDAIYQHMHSVSTPGGILGGGGLLGSLLGGRGNQGQGQYPM